MSSVLMLPMPARLPRPRPADGNGIFVPPAIAAAGEHAVRRFLEFFAATIRNKNTRLAYARAVSHFFTRCEDRGVADLHRIEPIVVAGYIEELGASRARPTVKQHLAAVRMLFDWLVTGGILPNNPAAPVRGPKHSVKRGKTPVLSVDQARTLLDSIPLTRVNAKTKAVEPDLAGLRDRALIGVMVYSFARVSATVAMQVEDYYPEGKRWWFRLHEKGGKLHQVPAHHNAEEYLDAWVRAGCIDRERKSWIFQTIGRDARPTGRAMSRTDALKMVKRRARAAGLPLSTSNHTFRATGITAYLDNGGTIENAQSIAAHESPRTTKLYDRTSDEITLDEIERIVI